MDGVSKQKDDVKLDQLDISYYYELHKDKLIDSDLKLKIFSRDISIVFW